MKKIFFAIAAVCCIAVSSQSCSKINEQLGDLDKRVTALEKSVSELQSFNDLLQALKDGDCVTSSIKNSDGSYTLKFYSGKTFTIANGKDGAPGADGEDGVDGEDGITPKFKIEDETWKVSYDEGATWEVVGSAIDRSLFSAVAVHEGVMFLTLADGTTVKFNVSAMSAKALILSAQAITAGHLVDGVIDNVNNTVTFPCSPNTLLEITSAKLAITISDFATTDFDPEGTYNLVDGLTVNVYAEDGETSKSYTLVAVAGSPKATLLKEALTVDGSTIGATSGALAFCGVDKFVVGSGTVYNFAGESVGTLNTDGIANSLKTITNDDKGVLVAYESSNPMGVYAWYDGYNNAPTKLFEVGADYSIYGSVAGDLNTGAVFSWRAAAAAANQQFQSVLYKKGDEEFTGWAILKTNCVGTDGNWGTMASPCNYDENKWGNVYFAIWDSVAGGNDVYAKLGTREDNEFVALLGDFSEAGEYEPGTSWASLKGNGCGYGNYTVGGIRGFQWYGRNYAAVFTQGWAFAAITIQTLNPEDVDHYLLKSTPFKGYGGGTFGGSYIFDPENECGYVGGATASGVAFLYKIHF